jgi:hypothetical protein
MAPLADNLPVFWTRLIVGGIDGIVGLCLSVSLLDLSKRGIESACEFFHIDFIGYLELIR